MTGQTTLTFWQLLAVALGPASLAALVAIVAPLVLDARKQAADLKRKRIEKLEELIKYLYEYDHWLNNNQTKYLFKKDMELDVTPMAKIKSIVYMYFPEFIGDLIRFEVLGSSYELWCAKAGRARNAGNKDYTEGFTEMYEPYSKNLRDFIDRLAEYSKQNLRN